MSFRILICPKLESWGLSVRNGLHFSWFPPPAPSYPFCEPRPLSSVLHSHLPLPDSGRWPLQSGDEPGPLPFTLLSWGEWWFQQLSSLPVPPEHPHCEGEQ